ncbi:hypothetical protein GGR50DRAFT_695634 [Xylaria sp. CBS 124048]|nr:hypothetical protein GGR50DRAFT_695634 [Xylaria sp. CBS 124048]
MDSTDALSDDWQQVDDSDTFSVISLPTSEAEILCSSPVETLGRPPHDLAPANQSDEPKLGPLTCYDLDEGLAQFGPDVVVAADSSSLEHCEGQLPETVSNVVGLEPLCEKLGSLFGLSSGVMFVLAREHYPPPAGEIEAKCEGLRSQLMCLQDIFDSENLHVFHMPPLSKPADEGLHIRSNGPHRAFDPTYLRRVLYKLKGQIATLLDEIHSYVRHGIFNDSVQCENIKVLMLSYRSIKESLALILSNNESDWISHAPKGGLTYSEFCQLNPDTIRSLICQLKEVTDDLLLERCRVQALRYGNDPDGFLHNEMLLIQESSLGMLRSIEEVLFSTLQIRI